MGRDILTISFYSGQNKQTKKKKYVRLQRIWTIIHTIQMSILTYVKHGRDYMIFKYSLNTSWNRLSGHFTNEEVELPLGATEMKQRDRDYDVTERSSEHTPGFQSSVLPLPQRKWSRPTAYSGLLGGKESHLLNRKRGLDPWVGKIPWRRKWQLTLVVSPGKSHGQGAGEPQTIGLQRVRHGLGTKQRRIF